MEVAAALGGSTTTKEELRVSLAYNIPLNMCVWLCVFLCGCVCVAMCVHASVHAHVYVRVCVCLRAYKFVHPCTCIGDSDSQGFNAHLFCCLNAPTCSM